MASSLAANKTPIPSPVSPTAASTRSIRNLFPFWATNLTDGSATLEPTFNYTLQLYLTLDGNGFLLSDNPPSMELAGQAYRQAPISLAASSLSGLYGLNIAQVYYNPPGNSGEIWSDTQYGQVNASSASSGVALAGFSDSNSGSTDFAISGTLEDGSNGIVTGTFSGLGPATPTTGSAYSCYLIDPDRAILIETDGDQLTLGYLTRP